MVEERRGLTFSTKVFSLCVLLGVLASLIVAFGEEDNPIDLDAKAQQLLSKDLLERELALQELLKAQVRADYQIDIGRKYEIFRELVKCPSAGFVYKAAYFFSKLPKDNDILRFAEEHLKSGEGNALLASLTYLETQKSDSFSRYFEEKEYEEIEPVLRRAFVSNDVIRKKREDYHARLLKHYIDWTPPEGLRDAGNPYRPLIVKEGPSIASHIVTAYKGNEKDALPVSIIWILGEIGSPAAFDLLIGEYLARPSERTAISAGACLSWPQFAELAGKTFAGNEKQLRTFLRHIYGEKWKDVSELQTNAILEHLHQDFVEFRMQCKRRSRPVLG